MSHSESDCSENELSFASNSQQIQNNQTETPTSSSSMFNKNCFYEIKLLKLTNTVKS